MTTTVGQPIIPDWASTLLGPGAALVAVFSGGASRDTLLLEAPAGAGRVVARHDGGAGPLSGTPYTLAREAATYAAVAGRDVPVPALVALAPDGSSFAVEEVPGTPEVGVEALDDYLGCLGRLHAAGTVLPPDDHAGFDDAGAEDLAIWESMAGELRRPAPIVHHAFDRLRAHGAHSPPQVVLCHGDAGPGNYLHDGSKVTGLIDWEMAHTGDPHDDLASIAVRAVLTGVDVGDLPARIASHHSPVSGVEFDQHRHRIAIAGVLVRMVISCLRALDHARSDTDRSIQLLGLPLMETHLLRTLALLDGHDLPTVADDDAGAGPDLEFAGELAGALADGLNRIARRPDAGTDPDEIRRLRFTATQIGTCLDTAADGDDRGEDRDALWRSANRRLAVLPASRHIAHAPIAGVT